MVKLEPKHLFCDTYHFTKPQSHGNVCVTLKRRDPAGNSFDKEVNTPLQGKQGSTGHQCTMAGR